jgi:outer membrane lipoprotein SlyB
MKYAFLAAALAFSFAAGSVPAEAKGCLKGAMVGGVAGHYAHHGVLGAVGGCIVGHHMAAEKEKNAAAQNQRPAPQPSNQ